MIHADIWYNTPVMDTRTYQVTGIVLRGHDYGEGHRLFSLFTREEGKILAIAKGIKKPRARLAPALQPFTLLELQLAHSRRMDVITHARVQQPFYGLRADLDAFAYASYFAELFDASLEERQSHPSLFDLLLDAFARLTSGGEAPDLLARYVEISLIAMLGYLPHLEFCAHCQAPLAPPDDEGRPAWPTWLGFSASQGGALCPACTPTTPGARRIAAGTVQVARLLLARGAHALHGLTLSDRLRHEIAATFREYLEYRLERPLHSLRFLDNLTPPLPDAMPITTA